MTMILSFALSRLIRGVAINQEARLLDPLGPSMSQFDETTISRYPHKVLEWGIEALDRCVDGIKSDTVVHVCYGYPRPNSPKRPIVDSYPTIIAALDKSNIDVLALEFEGANLDPALMKACPSKKVMFGCVFNSDSVWFTWPTARSRPGTATTPTCITSTCARDSAAASCSVYAVPPHGYLRGVASSSTGTIPTGTCTTRKPAPRVT